MFTCIGLGEILLIFQFFLFVVDYFRKVNYDCVFVVSDTSVQMNAGIGQLRSRSLRGQVVFDSRLQWLLHLPAAQFDFDGVVEG